MDSRLAFSALVALVAAERLVEIAVSRRNEQRLRVRGAFEAGAGHYPFMVALHGGFLVACLAEVWAFDRPFSPWLGGTMVILVAGTMGLRWWVIVTLGERWTTRVIVPPGAPLVTHGPFRLLRHPNYLAVALELFALPLVHSAWITSLVFGGANLALLRHRIRVEDAALRAPGHGARSPSGRLGRRDG